MRLQGQRNRTADAQLLPRQNDSIPRRLKISQFDKDFEQTQKHDFGPGKIMGYAATGLDNRLKLTIRQPAPPTGRFQDSALLKLGKSHVSHLPI